MTVRGSDVSIDWEDSFTSTPSRPKRSASINRSESPQHNRRVRSLVGAVHRVGIAHPKDHRPLSTRVHRTNAHPPPRASPTDSVLAPFKAFHPCWSPNCGSTVTSWPGCSRLSWPAARGSGFCR
jgi:hypothetical protein